MAPDEMTAGEASSDSGGSASAESSLSDEERQGRLAALTELLDLVRPAVQSDGGDLILVDDAVLRLVARLGGSISAEHGIGRAKARWLPLTRSKAEIAAMTAVKAALDPAGLLNPGAIMGTDGSR